MSSKRTFLKVLSLVTLVAATTLAAKADTLDFTLTGEGNTYTFSLPSSPTPAAYDTGAFAVVVPVIANGTAEAGTLMEFIPFSPGGIDLYIGLGNGISAIGPQLFTGPTSAPTFILGDFNLTSFSNHAPYTLGITDPSSSPVPQPASIVLLGTGALAFLGAGRRRFFLR